MPNAGKHQTVSTRHIKAAGDFRLLNLQDPTLSAEDVCGALNLQPHPEGGHYREIWRDDAATGQREAVSTILFLLKAGERSHWHRIDAAELWLWHAGSPLELTVAGQDGATSLHHLGPDLGRGHILQGIVPPHAWQSAESLGKWSLVGCVVAPAFSFARFELAPPGWEPSKSVK